MKYLNAEKLIAEVKGKIAELESKPAPADADRETILLQMCKTNAFREVLTVINRLEKNSPQQPDGYLEEDEIHLNNAILAAEKEWGAESCTVKFLKSLQSKGIAGRGVSMIITDETKWEDIDLFVHRNCDGATVIQIGKKEK